MAVKFKAVGAVGAVASGNLSLTPPTTATDDIMIVPLTSHDNVALTFPGGWTIVQEGNNTAAMRATVAWKRCVGAEGAFTVTHAAGDCLIGRVYLYSGCVKTGSPIDASSLSANASSSTCTATTITPSDVERLILFSMHDSDDGLSSVQKLNGVNMTERGDNTTTLGLDAAVSLSDLQVYDAAATGSATGTLSLGPDVNVGILLALIPQFGVTQPGGAATKLYIYHDPSSANATEFKPIEDLVATFPADAVNKTLSPFDGVQLAVDLQAGDDGDGPQVTTLAFTKGYLGFATGKGLSARISGTFGIQLGKLHLGVPVAAWGDPTEYGTNGCTLALGVAPSGEFFEIFIVGSKVTAASGAFALQAPQGYLADSVFENLGTGSGDSFSIGHDGLFVQRCAFIVATTTGPAITDWAPENSEQITVIGNGTYFVAPSVQTLLSTSKMRFIGTPSVADYGVLNAPAAWQLNKPEFSGNGPRFAWAAEPTNGIDTVVEYRGYGIKVFGNTLNALSGIPAKLEDTVAGITVFNTLTNASGEVSFTQQHPHYVFAPPPNGVIVRDYYCESDLVAKQRDRHFKLSVNVPGMTGYKPEFLSRVREFTWPDGKDVMDIVQLAEPAVAPPGWMECFVDAVA